MHLLDLTLPTAAENLALDEALLDAIDQQKTENNVFRVWEPAKPFVVLGRASKVEQEVELDYCQEHEIDVLRRCSGGATIVTGQGCLMYAAVLSVIENPQLAAIENVHQFVLERIQHGLQQAGLDVQIQGTSDLTWRGKKFSGNSLRCKKNAVLYHGTLMYDADIELICSCSRMPPRQPEYRQGKQHRDFITNLSISRSKLQNSIVDSWNILENMVEWPKIETDQLVQTRYLKPEWNFRH